MPSPWRSNERLNGNSLFWTLFCECRFFIWCISRIYVDTKMYGNFLSLWNKFFFTDFDKKAESLITDPSLHQNRTKTVFFFCRFNFLYFALNNVLDVVVELDGFFELVCVLVLPSARVRRRASVIKILKILKSQKSSKKSPWL